MSYGVVIVNCSEGHSDCQLSGVWGSCRKPLREWKVVPLLAVSSPSSYSLEEKQIRMWKKDVNIFYIRALRVSRPLSVDVDVVEQWFYPCCNQQKNEWLHGHWCKATTLGFRDSFVCDFHPPGMSRGVADEL